MLFYLLNEKDFFIFSNVISRLCIDNVLVVLFGSFGIGKTLFVKHFIFDMFSFFSFIKSPSYSYFDVYSLNNYHIYHIDFYRFYKLDIFNFFIDFFVNNKYFFLLELNNFTFLNIDCDLSIFIFYYSIYDRFFLIKSNRFNIYDLLIR